MAHLPAAMFFDFGLLEVLDLYPWRHWRRQTGGNLGNALIL